MKRKPEGMLMMSSNNGGGAPSERKKPPTAETQPVGQEQQPMEVVFTAGTIRMLEKKLRKERRWLSIPLFLLLVTVISGFFYWYWKTNVHIDDPTIHLTRGERGKLETKAEAKVERKKLKREITHHFDVKIREVKVEQREQILQLGKTLKRGQKQQFKKILTEVKKAHKD
jgi:hypothetical protein